MPPVILTASWVLPVATPPLRDGAVAVEDGRVRWVGRQGDPGQPEGATRALGDGVLLPALVNAHCHLELSHLAGLGARAAGFVPWVLAVLRERDSTSAEVREEKMREAITWIAERTATGAIGDVSNTLSSCAPCAASGLDAVIFHELIGWDPEEAERLVAAAEARLAAVPPALAGSVRLAAHAPHSVSGALLRVLRERGGPAAIHLAESAAERDFLRDGGGDWPQVLAARGLADVPFHPPGVSPVRYLEGLGVLHPGLLAAHCVYVDDVDAAILAEHGVSVVVCPRSNRNLKVGVPPIDRLLLANVRVCLGTDSLASGDDLDVAGEMYEVRRLFPDLPAHEILRMATASGAAALGLNDLGTLEPGRRGVFAFASGPVPAEGPEEHVIAGRARLAKLRAE